VQVLPPPFPPLPTDITVQSGPARTDSPCETSGGASLTWRFALPLRLFFPRILDSSLKVGGFSRDRVIAVQLFSFDQCLLSPTGGLNLVKKEIIRVLPPR